MELGIIGLGRMGANMTERLVLGGHRLISFDRSAEAIQRLVDKGAVGAHSLADFVKKYPRADDTAEGFGPDDSGHSVSGHAAGSGRCGGRARESRHVFR